MEPGESYDVFWLDTQQVPSHSHNVYSSVYIGPTAAEKLRQKMRSYSDIKEEPPMNDEQQEIREAVREAIEGPRREAEIAKRVAAVKEIGAEDKFEDDTVLRWKRKFGAREYTYVALRAGGKWYVSGNSSALGSGGNTWASLVEWMTTGENLITDLQVAPAVWNKIL